MGKAESRRAPAPRGATPPARRGESVRRRRGHRAHAPAHEGPRRRCRRPPPPDGEVHRPARRSDCLPHPFAGAPREPRQRSHVAEGQSVWSHRTRCSVRRPWLARPERCRGPKRGLGAFAQLAIRSPPHHVGVVHEHGGLHHWRVRRASSRSVLDALHVHTVEAAISTASPVWGLCPHRALRVQP